jgi:hypothetical protein
VRSNGFAHSRRNFAPGAFPASHEAHLRANGEAHSTQNFARSRFSAPQLEQRIWLPVEYRDKPIQWIEGVTPDRSGRFGWGSVAARDSAACPNEPSPAKSGAMLSNCGLNRLADALHVFDGEG